jgi:hypothetical protein
VCVQNLLESHLEKEERQFINTTDAVMNRIRKLKERDFIWDMLSYKVPEKYWDDDDSWYDTTEIPMLDLKEVLNSNDVLLIDTGELRSESSEIFTVLFLSHLWTTAQSIWTPTDEDYISNIIIEESANIARNEIVYRELLPKGREFNLSIGLIMQYPEQVLGENPRANKRAYKEILNNVNTKIIGNIATDDLLADALFHEDLDTDQIKDRISGLKRGEWVVQLPATGFDERKPEILTLKPVPIPPGHSEGPVTVRSRQEQVRQRSRDLHCLSNDHDLINIEQSIGSDHDDADTGSLSPTTTLDDSEVTPREHAFLDTVFRALNAQLEDINYHITDSMTKIKDHDDVVPDLKDKGLLKDDRDADNGTASNGASDTADTQNADNNRVETTDTDENEEDNNAEAITIGETHNKYYRPSDDAGALVGSSFNDAIGENGEESLTHRIGVILVGQYYEQQGYNVLYYEDDDFIDAVYDVVAEPTASSPDDLERVIEVETTPEHNSHVAEDYKSLASSTAKPVWVVEDRDSAYRLIRSVQEQLDTSLNKHSSVEEINEQVGAPGLEKIFTLNGLLDKLN